MDKYTVDLDQVLNDFEYSELTDQYSNASRFATGTTSAASHNNITKHSINNVFHSLNEYLNTSISVSGLNQIDNNLEVKNNCIEDVSVLSVSQSKFRDEEKSIKDCNLKTEGRLLDFAVQVRQDETGDEHEVKYPEENGHNVDSSKSSSNIESKETQEILRPVNDGSNELAEESCIRDDKEKTDVICEVNKESDVCDEDVHVEVRIQENLENEDKTLYINKEECSKTPDDDSKTDRNEAVKEAGYSKEQEQTVGFHDDLNLDDSEINRLLDELEDEGLEISEDQESQVAASDAATDTGNVEAVEETEATQGNDEHLKDAVSVLESTAIEENLHNESETPVEDHNAEVDVEDKHSKELDKSTEANGHLPLVEAGESNHQNEEHSVVMVESTLQYENEESQKGEETIDLKLNEEKLEEVTEEVKVENEDKMLEIEKENSQDSLSRPQNLPLKGEGEEPKRKINLIGDPGSTPYNNVYINKEIPKSKQKSYDSDTDYSTSSSPTFSDVSSTASTVSVDEVRNETDKNPQSQPQNSNTEIADVALDTSEHTEMVNAGIDGENPTPPTENLSAENSNPTNVTSNKPEQSEASSDGEIASLGGEDNLRNNLMVNTDEMSAGEPHVESMGEANVSAVSVGKQWLGKEAPLWIPDSDATSCLHCDMKFTVLKRRHHCRACGLVLCSKCCHLRFKLQYLEAEARVCNKCHDILNKDTNSSSGSDMSPDVGNSPSYRPHPNNPLEYCSTVSPLQQVAGSNPDPPAVMVPVGVLKRKGSNKGKSNKSVMFCDGIRPGSDLTNLDNDFDYNNTKTRKYEKTNTTPGKINKNLPRVDPETNTFIPSSENFLPPTVSLCKTDVSYMECSNNPSTVEMLKNEQLTFAIHISLNVHLKIINMSCCINKMAWCFSTEGLINVGQDEIVILLEYIDEESFVPKDVFYHINNVYNDAVKGTSVKEMGLSLHNTSNFLDSKNHAGFVYIRPTFQCLENVIKPVEPYLIGILIHRWETPWAKLFPLRLILRLGAEYRYYPSPIISTRHRESVFVEIGHTIINLLADFRNFSYTLPQIRGLTIHMEDKNTTIMIPANRYDQVMKSMNNSSDHILAFAGNFSLQADSHLVCIQDTQGNENCYSTHAINIHNKPRKVTGASFIVFNGALKSSSGLTAKSNIVEDGLMIQVLPEHMQQIRETLRAMKNHTIPCGCVNAASDETVNIVWGENDVNFNIGVVSAIDNMPLNGIPSIRVHNGKNHVCVNGSRIIRWTEVFIIQSGDDNPKNQDPIDISRVSESIAKATCEALVKYLDLLVANNCQKIGIRTTLHVENVSYSAGSNGTKLPPIYMKSLDNELIPVLHRITTNNLGENAVVLELIFRILNI